MAVKPLANRKNVKTPADGNSGVRFKDSTAKVASEITSGVRPQVSGKRPMTGGCSGCNK